MKMSRNSGIFLAFLSKNLPYLRNFKPNTMRLDKHLYQNGAFFAIGFFLFALLAFWPSYYSKIGEEMEVRFHTHGLAMTTWTLLLIAQAFLIRLKKFRIHRLIGKVSYFIFPLIIAATINLIHHQFQDTGQLTNMHFSNIALMVNATIALAIFYGLAIYYQKQPLVHARYMICTIFPMFTPVTDRLIYRHYRPLLDYMPTIDGYPVAPAAGFLLADILLVGLVIWDWRNNKRLGPFAVALGILLLYHTSVLYWYDTSVWKAFAKWFLQLPLS